MSAGKMLRAESPEKSRDRGSLLPAIDSLKLYLIGGCTLLWNDRTIPIKNRKALALFSYLAWVSPRAESRERLAGLLWSESDENSARTSLRQTLRQLRQSLGEVGLSALRSDRTELQLDTSVLSIDIRAAINGLKVGTIAPELLETKRIPESILLGFEDSDPMFRSWLLVQRQVVQDQLVAGLAQLLSAEHPASGTQVRDAALALANVDQSNESACRSLMRYYAEAGDIAASLRCYNSLWQLLEDDHDMEPSSETQALAAEIKSGEFERSLSKRSQDLVPAVQSGVTAKSALPSERRLVIYVSSFDTPKAQGEHDYLIQGMRTDLIARLVRFREWSVCESDRFSESNDETLLARQGLDIYDLEATAFPEKEQLRLVLTLRDRRQGHFIWSDWFYLKPETWFDTQSAVVRRIAIAMNVHLSAERLANFTASTELKPKLYDRWLAGQELSFRWRPETEVEAEKIFHDLIEEAPDFGPAYSSLVQIINSRHLVFPGVFRSSEREQETLALAKTAVMVDPLDSRAHLCLAWSNAMNAYFSQAELSYRLACDLNENDPWSLVSASLGLAFCDEIDLAHRLAEQALDVGLGASRLHWGYQTCVRFLEEDYERAIESADLAQDMMLGLPAWKAAALYHLGRQAEARKEGARFLDLVRSRWEGSEPPTDSNIMQWFMHLYPIRRRHQWERLRDGLAGAGVPVPDSDAFRHRR